MLGIFSVRDAKSETFHRPMPATTKGEALRGFMDEASDPQSIIYKHKEDFFLYQLGHFDETNGMIKPFETPLCLGGALELTTERGQDVV